MTIMSLGLMVILSGFLEGGRARENAERQTKALFLSQQVIDEWLTKAPLEAMEESGDWEEDPLYHWNLTVKPYLPEDAEEETGLMEVVLTTTWEERGRERSLSLKTLVPEAEP